MISTYSMKGILVLVSKSDILEQRFHLEDDAYTLTHVMRDDAHMLTHLHQMTTPPLACIHMRPQVKHSTAEPQAMVLL